MLEDKLSFRLNFNNLVFPNNSLSETFGDYFSSRSYNNWMHRSFSFSASYRMSNYKQMMERMNEGFEGGGGGGAGGGGGV